MLRASLCLCVSLLLPMGATSSPPGRSMVLTFDDLPAQRAQFLPEDRVAEINERLVELLASRGIPAIGFVNEDKLEVEGEVARRRVELLELWLDAGLELGNHSYSHPDLHRVPLGEFLDDITRGERVLRPTLKAYGLEPRFFRHPFLHTGTDLETKTAVENYLAAHSYRVAPVTIDNSEWIFARAYDEALDRTDTDLQQQLGDAYVDYMVAMTVYYEDQSRKLFDREIPQVMLLHANAINAHHLEALLLRLSERGYAFIDLETALADPAYASSDTFTGRGGITWLHRWALTREVDRSMFAGEPTTPDWVQETAGISE